MASKFLEALSPSVPSQFLAKIRARRAQASDLSDHRVWIFRNELRPSDLFCYLGARFGKPNGFQNYLRSDSSDNLIHWEWALDLDSCIVLFQGMNFRTEVHFIGESELCPTDEGDLVDQLKEDFANYGKEMADVRKHLEHWDEFINPYQRICASIDVLRRDLESLDLKPQDDAVPDLNHDTDMAEYQRQWTQVSERYSRGIGICFGIRAMLPVRAESFINMLLFILMRSDVRRDQRLFDSVFRQQSM